MTVDLTQYDPVGPLDGQYISPTWQQHPDERHVAETLGHLFIAGVIATKVLDWSGLARRWSERGYNADEFHETVTQRFVHILQQSAGAILMRAAGQGREQALMDFEASFPEEDWKQVAADWSQVYGHKMADQIGLQSQTAVENLVKFLLARGQKGDGLAITVKQAYGLDPRSMNGVINWLTNEKKPRNQSLLDVATSFLTRRARVIGDVQAFTGLNFGRQLTYIEAMDSGLLKKDAQKVWITAIDERVCPVCRPMDGVKVGMMEPFVITTKQQGNIKLLVPPVHPNCRCTVVPEERFRHGIITRTARFSDEGPHHRGRLTSALEDLVSLGKSDEVEKKFDAEQPRDRAGRWVGGGQVLDLDYRQVAHALNSLPSKRHEIWASHQAFLHYHKTKRALGRHGEAFEHLHLGITRWLDMEGVAQVRRIEGGPQTNPGSWRGFLKNHAKYDGPLRMLMHTVSYAPANAPVLYRGMAVPHEIELPKQGQKFNLPLSSFAAHQDVALNYTGTTPKWYQRKKGHTTPVLVVLEGGSKSLNISPIARYGKSEWLTKGRYVVTGVSARKYNTESGTRKVKTIYVKQLPKRDRVVEKANRDLVFFDLLATPMPAEEISKFDTTEARDTAGRWVKGAESHVAEASGHDLVAGAAVAAGLAVVMVPMAKNPAMRKTVESILHVAANAAPMEGAEAAKYADIFNGFQHGGLIASVDQVVRRGRMVQVTGSVKTGRGAYAGTFTRRFRGDSVDHSFFVVEDAHQGSGFGSAFIAHAFDEYKKMGIKKVTVHANIDVGGYTWASMGFKFSNPRGEMNLLGRLRSPSRAGVVNITPEEEEEFRRIARRMMLGGGSPQDIAKVGIDRTWRRQGQKMWAGKALLLNSDWMGVFNL